MALTPQEEQELLMLETENAEREKIREAAMPARIISAILAPQLGPKFGPELFSNPAGSARGFLRGMAGGASFGGYPAATAGLETLAGNGDFATNYENINQKLRYQAQETPNSMLYGNVAGSMMNPLSSASFFGKLFKNPLLNSTAKGAISGLSGGVSGALSEGSPESVPDSAVLGGILGTLLGFGGGVLKSLGFTALNSGMGYKAAPGEHEMGLRSPGQVISDENVVAFTPGGLLDKLKALASQTGREIDSRFITNETKNLPVNVPVGVTPKDFYDLGERYFDANLPKESFQALDIGERLARAESNTIGLNDARVAKGIFSDTAFGSNGIAKKSLEALGAQRIRSDLRRGMEKTLADANLPGYKEANKGLQEILIAKKWAENALMQKHAFTVPYFLQKTVGNPFLGLLLSKIGGAISNPGVVAGTSYVGNKPTDGGSY